MCGITGMVMGRRERTAEELEWIRQTFSNLMLETEVRGSDATGAFVVNKGSINYYKAPDPASEAIHTPEWWGLMDKITSETLAVIGHTRFATLGEPDNNENNHPICVDNIIGVHNGVIRNHEEIKVRHDLQGLPEVDSSVIFGLISSKSTKSSASTETIADSLAELEGDMAIVLVDSRRTDSVFVARDSGRPLVFTNCNSRQLMIMASTASILRKGLYLEKHKEAVVDTYHLPANTVARLTHRHGSGAIIKATRWYPKKSPFTLSTDRTTPRSRLDEFLGEV